MNATITTRVLLVTLVATSLTLALQQQEPQQQQQQLQNKQQDQITTMSPPVQQLDGGNLKPSYEHTQPQDKAVWPMVDVDRQQNKSTVDVHVPIFFDMTNHKDAESGRSKLDLSVLQGLVTVNKDRVPDQNGQMTGPMKVTVFGIPVYQGKSLASSPQRELDNSITQTRSSLNHLASDASNQIANNLRQTNDKLMNSLSDIFQRLTSVVRQASHAIVQPSASAQQSAREMRQQQQQPLPYAEQSGRNIERAPSSSAVASNQIERMPMRNVQDERQMLAAN